MVYNLIMYRRRPRVTVLAAVLLAAVLLGFLLWRGLNEESEEDLHPEFAWREAGDEDLF